MIIWPAAFGCVSLLLVSCSCEAPVSVAGSLQDGIRFDLREKVKVPHANVTVFEDDSETVIWEIQGNAKVGVIHYGVAPDNAIAKVAPVPLESGKTYLLTLMTRSTFLGPPCGGAVLFTISAAGHPVECRDLEACAAKGVRG